MLWTCGRTRTTESSLWRAKDCDELSLVRRRTGSVALAEDSCILYGTTTDSCMALLEKTTEWLHPDGIGWGAPRAAGRARAGLGGGARGPRSDDDPAALRAEQGAAGRLRRGAAPARNCC